MATVCVVNFALCRTPSKHRGNGRLVFYQNFKCLFVCFSNMNNTPLECCVNFQQQQQQQQEIFIIIKYGWPLAHLWLYTYVYSSLFVVVAICVFTINDRTHSNLKQNKTHEHGWSNNNNNNNETCEQFNRYTFIFEMLVQIKCYSCFPMWIICRKDALYISSFKCYEQTTKMAVCARLFVALSSLNGPKRM